MRQRSSVVLLSLLSSACSGAPDGASEFQEVRPSPPAPPPTAADRAGTDRAPFCGEPPPRLIRAALAAVPETCTPLSPTPPTCPEGVFFDAELQRCATDTDAFGPFTSYQIKACQAYGGGDVCVSNRWNRAFYREIAETSGLRGLSLNTVLDEARARADVYCLPTEQDGEGRGIMPAQGEREGRSETIYPPFVLAPRRQTDSLVRQLYRLLPENVRAHTAFVVADRLMQNPEAYVRYIRSRARTVIVGSFVGIGTATTLPDWARVRHTRELWKLRASIALVHALGREVADVAYAMGDSTSSAAEPVRADLEARLTRMLAAARLARLDSRVGWGADEMVAIGFARQLPPARVFVRFENPDAPQHYDSERSAAEVLRNKLAALHFTEVTKTSNADFEVAVLSRRPGGFNADFQANDAAQAALDDAFTAPYRSATPKQLSRVAFIDGRLFNGAWDGRSVVPGCAPLAFGAWGTFGNVAGTTLAAARIVLASRNDAARRQLLLEAVAHDVLANGYADAQRGGLRDEINAALGPGTYNHFNGYMTADTTARVFEIVNAHVRARLGALVGSCLGRDEVRFTPQLWRTFESAAHLRGTAAPDFLPGVWRTDLPAAAFDPTEGRTIRLGVPELVAEGRD